jgi:uncharacterized protein (TIGR03067 family)
MQSRFSMLLVLGLLVAAEGPKEDAAKRDVQKLQGTWTVVSAEREGQPLDRIKGNKLTLKGDRFTIKTKTVELTGTFRLDPAKKPKAMDWMHEADALRDKTWQSIYLLEGGSLKICYAEADSGKDRPTEFATTEGSGLQLVVLKRDEP